MPDDPDSFAGLVGKSTLGSSAPYGGSSLYSVSYERDDLGRIEQKTETIGGTTTYGYAYDNRGRLTDVTKDGASYRSYTYDANGNRTSASEDGGTAITGTYDAQDRLTSYGNATYTYTPDGQLRTKTVGGETTTYTYDELGSLLKAELPGKTIDYVVDGLARRVAKKVDGTVTDRFVYGQGFQPVAELNASGGIKSQFVYASKPHTPDLMIRNGVTYRFVTDQVGSVRMVVNTTDGTVAQQIDYDPFGKVLSDTNPGFQPFGFAAGLYDADTGLVRFGARDYDATSGRWTAKDPILFDGGDTNLYRYVGSDSINFADPTGLVKCTMGYMVDTWSQWGWAAMEWYEPYRWKVVGGLGIAICVIGTLGACAAGTGLVYGGQTTNDVVNNQYSWGAAASANFDASLILFLPGAAAVTRTHRILAEIPAIACALHDDCSAPAGDSP